MKGRIKKGLLICIMFGLFIFIGSEDIYANTVFKPIPIDREDKSSRTGRASEYGYYCDSSLQPFRVAEDGNSFYSKPQFEFSIYDEIVFNLGLTPNLFVKSMRLVVYKNGTEYRSYIYDDTAEHILILTCDAGNFDAGAYTYKWIGEVALDSPSGEVGNLSVPTSSDSDMGYFTVNDPAITCSSTSVSLDLYGSTSKTVKLTRANMKDSSGFYYTANNANTGVSWSGWSGNTGSFTLNAAKIGTTIIKCYVKNTVTSADMLLCTISIDVSDSRPRYIITYNANGGTQAPASQTKIYKQNITLSNQKPVRSGHTFKGWATTKSATKAEYMPNASFNRNADTTLYAVWEDVLNNTFPNNTPKLTVKITGANKVKLSWKKVENAEEYIVYRKEGKNGTFKSIKTLNGSQTSFTNQKLQHNQIYYYKIAAQRTSNGKKVYSKSSAIVNKKAVGKPKKLNVKSQLNNAGKLKLYWSKQSGLKEIVLYRKINNGKYRAWKKLKGKSKSVTFSVTSFDVNNTYQFKLRTYYLKDGVKIWSSDSRVVKISNRNG